MSQNDDYLLKGALRRVQVVDVVRSYPAPHCGRPGEVGGSLPRDACGAGTGEDVGPVQTAPRYHELRKKKYSADVVLEKMRTEKTAASLKDAKSFLKENGVDADELDEKGIDEQLQSMIDEWDVELEATPEGADPAWMENINQPGPTMVYRGVARDKLGNIIQDGILLNENSWYEREPSVYFTTDPKGAKSFAYSWAREKYDAASAEEKKQMREQGVFMAVIGFEITDDMDDSVYEDENYSDKGFSFRTESDIPAENIRSIEVEEAGFGKEFVWSGTSTLDYLRSASPLVEQRAAELESRGLKELRAIHTEFREAVMRETGENIGASGSSKKGIVASIVLHSGDSIWRENGDDWIPHIRESATEKSLTKRISGMENVDDIRAMGREALASSKERTGYLTIAMIDDIQQDVPENVQEDVQQNVQEDVQQERGEVTQARGGISINIDEEAGDWIKKVRDGGGGLTIGPDDGIIAVPEGPGERETVEEEPLESEPETVDGIRKLGRDALASPVDEEEVEGAIKKTMLAIRRLMSGVERTLRRDHD